MSQNFLIFTCYQTVVESFYLFYIQWENLELFFIFVYLYIYTNGSYFLFCFKNTNLHHSIVGSIPFRGKTSGVRSRPVRARLYKSISIIKAEPIQSSPGAKELASFLASISLCPLPETSWYPLLSSPSHSISSHLSVKTTVLLPRGVVWKPVVYIIKESASFLTRETHAHTHTHYQYISREIPACVTQEAPRHAGHYSGLNNIMSRGKRDLCNWTRERARSAGSASKKLSFLSRSSRCRVFYLSPRLTVCYVLSRWETVVTKSRRIHPDSDVTDLFANTSGLFN